MTRRRHPSPHPRDPGTPKPHPGPRGAPAARSVAALLVAVAPLTACGDGCSGAGSPDAPRTAPSEPPGAPRASGERPGSGDREGTGSPRTPCRFPEDASLAAAEVPPGYCPWVFADDLDQPRGMVVVAGSRVLVVERGAAQVTLLEDRDGDGVVDGEGERRALARAPGLNHGIAVHRRHLYASSPSTVYRWPFSPDAAPPAGLLEGRSTVLQGMPTGGHSTRTLLPKDGHLYVSVGSGSNVDRDSERSRVVRISLDELPEEGFVWDGDGVELWADGLRNEVGLALDGRGRLWGVQNGIDNLHRGDLGGDIHADNPAEELNLLTQPGAFHGYPYCWTEYRLDRGRGRGTQWAHPQSRQRYGDDWCRDPDHVVPPRLAMQAHAAPLDLLFYRGAAFPGSVTGDLFVSFHGSWNRPEPTGYEVIRVPFPDPDRPEAPVPFLRYRGRGATGDAWPHRPVALATTDAGVLLVSSDRSGSVLAVDHRGPDGGDAR